MIALQPDAHQGRVNLAWVYQAQHKWIEAVHELDEAVHMRPADPALYYTRARLHLDRGDRQAARRDFKLTIEHETAARSLRSASAHVELSHLNHLEQKYEDALAECDAALATWPNYSLAYRQQGSTLLVQGRLREAAGAFDAFLASGGRRDAELLLAQGLIHMQLGDHARAIDAFTLALSQRRDPHVLAYRGWIYLRQQAASLALADFNAALDMQENHLEALTGRAMALALLGQTAGVIEDTERALQQGPRTASLLLNGARIYARCLQTRMAQPARV